jgi:hypothetical protein
MLGFHSPFASPVIPRRPEGTNPENHGSGFRS